MAESSVIKEFLIALGFKVNKGPMVEFESAVKHTTFVVAGLATAIEATAIKVAYSVGKFANNLEQLYFASQRTGASANNLKAFGAAAANFGASVESARGSVEGLAKFMRDNPASGAFFQVSTKNADGTDRDTVEVMRDLAKQFQTEPIWLAEQRSSQMGIDEKTMLAMRNGEFETELNRQQKQMANPGFKKASEDAHKFMIDLRDLGIQLERFGLQIYDAIQRKLGVSLKSVTEYMRVHGPEIAAKVAEIASRLLDFLNRLVVWFEKNGAHLTDDIIKGLNFLKDAIDYLEPKVEWLLGVFKSLDAATGGWSTKILELTAALKFLGAGGLITGGLKILAKIGGWFGRSAVAAEAGEATGLFATGALGLAGLGTAGGVGLGFLINKLFPDGWAAKIGNKIGGAFFDAQHQTEDHVQQLTNLGMGREQAIGLIANMSAESSMNPYAVSEDGGAKGLMQWRGSRQDDFKKFAGYSIDDKKVDRDTMMRKQIEFALEEMRHGKENDTWMKLKDTDNAADAAYIIDMFNERNEGGEKEAMRRGVNAQAWSLQHSVSAAQQPAAITKARNAATVKAPDQSAAPATGANVNQETTIHVNGTADAHETAAIVLREQGRVNAGLVRNLQPNLV